MVWRRLGSNPLGDGSQSGSRICVHLQMKALKIKLKKRDPPPVSNVGAKPQLPSASGQQVAEQPLDSGQQKNAEALQEKDGKVGALDEESSRTGPLKRKLQPPSLSPAPKRSAREESPISEAPVPLSATGEPLEVHPGKSVQLSTNPLVIKHRVGQPHSSVSDLVQREQAVQLYSRLEDDESKTGKSKAAPVVLENLSQGQLQVISVVSTDRAGSSEASSPGKQDETDILDSILRITTDVAINHQLSSWMLANSRKQALQGQVAALPSHAGWFAWGSVHKLERQGLPQFFYGKSKLQAPELYMQVRNAMIGKYRLNPRKHICLEDVRGLNGFSDKDLNRILEFLTHWGLLNYQTEPYGESKGSKQYASFSGRMEEDGCGGLQPLPTFLTPLETLYQFDSSRAPSVVLQVPNSGTSNSFSSASLADFGVMEAHVRSQGLNSGYHCSACGVKCSQRRYSCEKQVDFVLCADCFSDGKFGVGMMTADFILVDACSEAVDSSDSVSWTDQETLMLLEALELFGDNWNEISEFVGTKTKAQCISHFIGLPIEDKFIEDMEMPKGFVLPECQKHGPGHDSFRSLHLEGGINDVKGSENCLRMGSVEADQIVQTGHKHVIKPDEPLKDLSFPETAKITEKEKSQPDTMIVFAESGNPVMALVAFLAAMVGPRVAAAAAHTALLSLSEDYQTSQFGVERAVVDMQGVGPTTSQSRSGILVTTMEEKLCGFDHETGKDGANEEQNTQASDSAHNGQTFLPAESVKKATASALLAAAVKAKLLADHEEREIQRLSAIITDYQLKKIDIKLKQLGEIDPALEKECEQLERNRQRLSAERTRFMGARLGSSAGMPSQVAVTTAVTGPTSIRPPGPNLGSAMPATILQGAAHSSGMLRPTLFTMGPGGMAIPVSTTSIVKPPSL